MTQRSTYNCILTSEKRESVAAYTIKRLSDTTKIKNCVISTLFEKKLHKWRERWKKSDEFSYRENYLKISCASCPGTLEKSDEFSYRDNHLKISRAPSAEMIFLQNPFSSSKYLHKKIDRSSYIIQCFFDINLISRQEHCNINRYRCFYCNAAFSNIAFCSAAFSNAAFTRAVFTRALFRAMHRSTMQHSAK